MNTRLPRSRDLKRSASVTCADILLSSFTPIYRLTSSRPMSAIHRGPGPSRLPRLQCARFVIESSTSPISLMSERENLEREELLDHQDPLRHLRSSEADGVLIPAQLPSILDQRTNILISSINPGDPGITVKLALNAAPGCGGIAWPAGEASNPSQRV